MKYRDLERKKRYSRDYVIPSLIKNEFYDRADKISNCSTFIKTAICDSCYSTHFDGTYSCHDRLCPVCAKKRTLAWSIKLVPILIELLRRGYHLNMFSFTIRTSQETKLETAMSLLYDSWRYLTHENKQYRKRFNELVLGGVRSLEVKMGERELEDGTKVSTECWHPHFHVLVCTHGNIPYKELQHELFDMWNNSLRVVSKVEFDNSLGTINVKSVHCNSETTLLKSILEVFKYITKFDWQSDHVKELVNALNGVKGLNTFGNFRCLLKDIDVEKMMDDSLSELEDRFCVVCGNTSFIYADVYDTGNLLIQDFENTKFGFLSALSTFDEID